MLYTSEIVIPGAGMPRKNPFAQFQGPDRNREFLTDGTLKEEETILGGYETAWRCLPYRMQDRYTRDRVPQKLLTVVLENDFLKAVFLPAFGGRLYSLYHKALKRELLYTNPVIQPANLALRDAWISGGIEWNMGQLGHSFTTCEPLFCCAMKDKDGEDYLRMYEYERCHELFWQMDFHLSKDSQVLKAYVRIVNDRDEDRPLYWWTNCAVPETKDARIFSCTDEVIYLNMDDFSFGKGQLPFLPCMPDADATYPANFKYSNEYFFQNPKGTKSPWEVSAYEDWAFFERSSSRLLYRKMFCWGQHQGGKHWKDYLSEKGKGNYIEIQAGFARTQMHGLVLPAGETVEFVQCFGGFSRAPQAAGLSYAEERKCLEWEMDAVLCAEKTEELLLELRSYCGEKPEHFLCFGSGYGALETVRRKKQGDKEIPGGFYFPSESISREQAGWLNLLMDGCYRQEEEQGPDSFMVQKEWKELLLESEPTALGLVQLAVIEIENGEYEEARQHLKQSVSLRETASAYYYQAVLARKEGSFKKAADAYQKAAEIGTEEEQVVVYREYLRMLKDCGRFEDLETVYRTLPGFLQDEEKIYLNHIAACIELGDWAEAEKAFDREYVYIRENETSLSDIWLRFHQKRHEEETGEPWTLKQAEAHDPVPYKLDFRTS